MVNVELLPAIFCLFSGIVRDLGKGHIWQKPILQGTMSVQVEPVMQRVEDNFKCGQKPPNSFWLFPVQAKAAF